MDAQIKKVKPNFDRLGQQTSWGGQKKEPKVFNKII
jgi:hypothetical protein